MNIEIKNLKFATFASQETNCFEAAIYIDGIKAGTARNEGHGGPTNIQPTECLKKLNEYAATLPKVVTKIPDKQDPSGFWCLQPTGEFLIDDLVADTLTQQDVKKTLAKRILYTLPGKLGIYQTKVLKADALRQTLARPDLSKLLNSDKILNLLPLADAIALYKSSRA